MPDPGPVSASKRWRPRPKLSWDVLKSPSLKFLVRKTKQNTLFRSNKLNKWSLAPARGARSSSDSSSGPQPRTCGKAPFWGVARRLRTAPVCFSHRGKVNPAAGTARKGHEAAGAEGQDPGRGRRRDMGRGPTARTQEASLPAPPPAERGPGWGREPGEESGPAGAGVNRGEGAPSGAEGGGDRGRGGGWADLDGAAPKAGARKGGRTDRWTRRPRAELLPSSGGRAEDPLESQPSGRHGDAAVVLQLEHAGACARRSSCRRSRPCWGRSFAGHQPPEPAAELAG